MGSDSVRAKPTAPEPPRGGTFVRARRGVPRDAGMTAIELILVLVVLGVTLGLAIATLDATPWTRRAAAAEVNQRLRAARTLAVLRQHDVIVEFDAAGHRFLVHEDADGDGARDDGERVLRYALEDGGRFDRGSAPPHAGFTDGPIAFTGGRVVFRRNGSASEEGAVYVAHGVGDDRPFIVVVTRATGSTRTLRYDGTSWVP